MIHSLYKKGVALLLACTFAIQTQVLAEPITPDESNLPSSEVSSETNSSETSSEEASGQEPSSDSSATESEVFSDVSEESPSSNTSSTPDVNSQEISSAVHSIPPAASSKNTSSRNKQPKPTVSPEWDDEPALSNACDWLKNNEEGDYYFIALGGAGKTIDSKRYELLLSAITNADFAASDLYTLSLWALDVTFCGVSATNVRGVNLIDKITAFSGTDNPNEAISMALLALDSNDYEVAPSAVLTRETLIQQLVARQQSDGSFAAQKQDNIYKSTALALIALSSYSDDPSVKNVLNQGMEYLRAQYTKLSEKEESALTLSLIIASMSSLGINVNDTRFMNGRQTIDELLLKYIGDDGGFKQFLSDERGSVLATEWAVIALNSIKFFTNPLELRQTLNNAGSSSSTSAPADSASFSGLFFIILAVLVILLAGGSIVLIILLRKKKNAAEKQEE